MLCVKISRVAVRKDFRNKGFLRNSCNLLDGGSEFAPARCLSLGGAAVSPCLAVSTELVYLGSTSAPEEILRSKK